MSDTLTLQPSRDSLKLEKAAGIPGEAATVTVGTVTTLAAGEDATVVNAGTAYNATFNFAIPQGDQGIQGEQGIQGVQGIQGIQGPAGDYTPGGTDVAVADGGSGRSSHTAYAVICGGTTTTAAQQSIASVGTAGQILTSNGPGFLPTFQSGVAGGLTLIASGSLSGTATNITSIPATYSHLLLKIVSASFDNTATLVVRHSINNGSSYISSGYFGFTIDGSNTVAQAATSGIAASASATSGQDLFAQLAIFGYQGNNYITCRGFALISGGTRHDLQTSYGSGVTALDAISITSVGGTASFDGGIYALYGAS